jgi:hypothetical protein
MLNYIRRQLLIKKLIGLNYNKVLIEANNCNLQIRQIEIDGNRILLRYYCPSRINVTTKDGIIIAKF